MSNSTWQEKYNEVLGSFRWQGLRMRLIRECGGVCERCHKHKRPLELHHKQYERLGQEQDDDLEVLCRECHEIADGERAMLGRQNSEAALDAARLNGWASKRYGENWYEFVDEIVAAEKFEDWLQSREDY